MTDPHDDNLKNTVRKTMEVRETEELLAIWTANRRYEWTEDAFAAVHDILVERLGEAPPQKEAVDEEWEEEDEEEEESWLSRGFHWLHHLDLLALVRWAGILAWVVLLAPLIFTPLSFTNGVEASGGLFIMAVYMASALMTGLYQFFILICIRYILLYIHSYLEPRGMQPSESQGAGGNGRTLQVVEETRRDKLVRGLAVLAGILSWVVVFLGLWGLVLRIYNWYDYNWYDLAYRGVSFWNPGAFIKAILPLVQREIDLLIEAAVSFVILQAIRYGLLGLRDLLQAERRKEMAISGLEEKEDDDGEYEI